MTRMRCHNPDPSVSLLAGMCVVYHTECSPECLTCPVPLSTALSSESLRRCWPFTTKKFTPEGLEAGLKIDAVNITSYTDKKCRPVQTTNQASAGLFAGAPGCSQVEKYHSQTQHHLCQRRETDRDEL